MSYSDKEKNNAYMKAWRDNHPGYHSNRPDKDIQKELRNKKSQEKKTTLIEYLGGKCVGCGTTHNLEFDHIDRSKKRFTMGSNLWRKLDDLITEADNCRLLCKSCHEVKTRANADHNAILKGHTLSSVQYIDDNIIIIYKRD